MSDVSQQTDAQWTIGRLLSWTREHFQSQGIDEPRLSAELLLAHALGCRKIELYTRFEESPPPEKRTAFRELVKAAARHEPISYLIGRKEFYSLEFEVTADVLIPRPETELLVERTLAHFKVLDRAEPRMLDMGTGSGCITIAVLKRSKSATAVATDISAGALTVAKRNADRHGVGERVTWIETNWLDLPADKLPSGGFDVIAANPPYIALRDKATIPENVREYEPHAALFAGEDGLDAFRAIAPAARRLLKDDGVVLLEIAMNQAKEVIAIFERADAWRLLNQYKDGAGIDRVLEFGPRS
jgi:release factor glutamine methyltransferase